MALYSRPNLENLQFKQTKGSELDLSGTTRFKIPGGIEIATDSTGTTVPIIATGATSGHVLTYIGGEIKLSPAGAASDICFDSCREVTRSGIPNVNVSGCTVNQFLEGYFFPAVGPSSSLSIASGGADREFGAGGTGNLCYQACRETNQICLIIANDDGAVGYDTCIVSTPIAGDCCGTIGYTIPNSQCYLPSTCPLQTSVSYQVCVEDSSGCASVSSANITWKNKRYSFKSSTLYTDGTISTTLSGGELSTTKAKTISDTFNNQFFYYVYPKIFGTPSFTVNGLPNNAWGNLGSGTLYEFSYTNSNGYTTDYYVARSDSKITGSFNIIIS